MTELPLGGLFISQHVRCMKEGKEGKIGQERKEIGRIFVAFFFFFFPPLFRKNGYLHSSLCERVLRIKMKCKKFRIRILGLVWFGLQKHFSS